MTLSISMVWFLTEVSTDSVDAFTVLKDFLYCLSSTFIVPFMQAVIISQNKQKLGGATMNF